jgi:hypothetical protein
MGPLIRTVTERLGGKKPSPVRAMLAATIAGVGVGALTYKALRR